MCWRNLVGMQIFHLKLYTIIKLACSQGIFFHTALSWRKFLLTTLITKLEIYDRVESRHSFKIYIEKIVYIALRKMCFHSLYQRPTAGCAALLLKRLLLNKLALNKKKEKENSAVISFQQKVKYNQAMLLCTILE